MNDRNAWKAQPFQPERLKMAREARGLSKGELRIATRGLPVGSYENGTITPGFNEITWLVRALRFPHSFFCRRDRPPTDLSGLSSLDLHFKGSKKRPPRCSCRRRSATHLCDGKLVGGKPCDAPICTRCRVRVGPNADLCRACDARENPGRSPDLPLFHALEETK